MFVAASGVAVHANRNAATAPISVCGHFPITLNF